ncbi:hypothetical protein LUTEI9C_70434 [Luteimonas sp. 9C]|nr:hypothetical protein LUTEI9C_70434 [Luteimonas sp. 9C]
MGGLSPPPPAGEGWVGAIRPTLETQARASTP